MMLQGFKPLLAVPVEDFVFPAYASIKIDGIRGCVLPEPGLVSRKILPIPNAYIRSLLTMPALWHHDGEILTYTSGKMDNFNLVQSKVMSEDGSPEFLYYMFDHFEFPERRFEDRMPLIKQGVAFTKRVNQILVRDMAELLALEAQAIADGWEGLIVRSRDGRYKFGRSTAKEGILLKMVKKQRAEAVIVGTYERMHNANEATTDALGNTKRSSHQDNKVGRDDLGGLNLLWDGMVSGHLFSGVVIPSGGAVPFDCGTGFDDATREKFWKIRDQLIGQIITFEFRGVGTNSKPRFPAFIGLRDERDLG